MLTCFLRNSGMAKNHGILGDYSGLNLQSLMWVLMVDDKVVSHIHYNGDCSVHQVDDAFLLCSCPDAKTSLRIF